MKNKLKCDSCEVRGYSHDLCKAHIRKMAIERNDEGCPRYTPSIIKHTKTAAYGAGIGLVAVYGGLAAIPTIGLKGLFGHLTAAKLSAEAGGGLAGAGINIFRRAKNEKQMNHKKHNKKRRYLCFPLTSNGGKTNG